MTFFVWDDNLSVGNTFIDNDHRHLIDLVNQLYKDIEADQNRQVIGQVLDALILYTQEHFKREENVMLGLHYAGFSEHKKAHEHLTASVLVLREKFARSEPELSVELLVFLYELLFGHVMQVDRALGKVILESGTEAKLPV